MRPPRFLVVLAASAIAACGGGSESTAVPPAPVITRVDVSIASGALYIGQSSQVTAVVRDDKGAAMSTTVTYESSATGVATVNSSGLVSAVGPGTATISASAGGKMGTVSVTVQAVPAASVSLTPGRSHIVTGDTVQLTATVRDSAGTAITGHTVVWSVTDTTVATVNASGRLIPKTAGTVTVRATASGRSAETPLTIVIGRGLRVPELAVFDSVVPALLATYRLPGASFAVMKEGKLLTVRSYGWADTTTKQVAQPTSIFRFASLSKSITAAAMMKLVEEGKVSLDEKVFTILSDLTPPPGQTADARLANITVRHALSHQAGWHAAGNVDPLWYSRTAAVALGDTTPASARTLARYWMGLPLTFAPGTDWSYGQIGYVLAHLVIEKRSGKSYEQYVRDNVLTPVGASSIAPGKSRLEDRRPNEVTYYYPGTMQDNTRLSGTVPAAYGWHTLEGNIAAAGWSGTVTDYLRFFAGIDQHAGRADILASASIDQMFARPPIWDGAVTWYGLGWYSRGTGPNAVVYHGGNTWGTANWVRRLDNGVTLALLTNGPVTPAEQATFTAINNALVAGAALVTTWPTTDQFSKF